MRPTDPAKLNEWRTRRRWYFRIFLGRDAEGRKRYHNLSVLSSRREAQVALTEAMRHKDQGWFKSPTKDSLSQCFQKWLAGRRLKVRERTRAGYLDLFKRYVAPELGALRICHQKAEDV